MTTVVGDIEVYRNVCLFGFELLETGRRVILEESERSKVDRLKLRDMLLRHTFVGFNSMSYDAPMLWYFILKDATPAMMKVASDKIIKGRLRYWEVEDALGIRIPRAFEHIDLIEPQPNPIASLKTLNGRMHGKTLQDLPYDPDDVLTFEQIDRLTAYLHNDIQATKDLWHALAEPMELRRIVGAQIGVNVMSKSDGQMGLSIVKHRVEAATGAKVGRSKVKPGDSFRYNAPANIGFANPQLRSILARIREHDFVVKDDGKVDLPKWLEQEKIAIGSSVYQMGIGGLHSTEAGRAIVSDEDNALCDVDVGSFYPAITILVGLFPDAIGPIFLQIYRQIRADRMTAKKEAKRLKNELAEAKRQVREDIAATIARLKQEHALSSAMEKGLKIVMNAGLFGNLGSGYSFVYAPSLMIAITLTGQLSLLMLIEQAEDAGIPAVSGNTDGVVFYCPRDQWGGIALDADGNRTSRLNPCGLGNVIDGWEKQTGFDLEATEYSALYSQSVNTYIALKADGGHKLKGPPANPWSEDPSDNDPRGRLMKNPQMTICSDAALALIKHGTPVEETIRACTDIRQFITVIKADGGATWRGEYLGKVVRYYWGRDGSPLIKIRGDAKVPKTDGAIECMVLPDQLPDDIDYEKYIAETEDLLRDLGYYRKPMKPLRLFKSTWRRVLIEWLAVA